MAESKIARELNLDRSTISRDIKAGVQSKIEAIDDIILELFTNTASSNTKIAFPH
jgi:hypothetical protein